jgi:hypothetical protein
MIAPKRQSGRVRITKLVRGGPRCEGQRARLILLKNSMPRPSKQSHGRVQQNLFATKDCIFAN